MKRKKIIKTLEKDLKDLSQSFDTSKKGDDNIRAGMETLKHVLKLLKKKKNESRRYSIDNT